MMRVKRWEKKSAEWFVPRPADDDFSLNHLLNLLASSKEVQRID
jgi:hypothetical protein